MKNSSIFHSPSKGRLQLTKVVREISDFVSQDSQDKYQLIVGTDSNGDKQADFVTAIIVYRVGHGGRYFWKRTNGRKVYHTLRDRIYKEVTLSLEIAQDLLAQLKSLLEASQELNYDFQIHIDVGQNGPTREMIKEVVGMVRGNGFKAKIKPASYAASHVADRYI
ncbi:MAG: ribonuclease H-like YkuK family protein [Candidatus Portnoybacteria bacterium]|nr:ribonuclease H-like YkuK family protein [Candidatus Portnoybacteria bacterium]